MEQKFVLISSTFVPSLMFMTQTEGWTGIGIRCTRRWNSLDNASSSIDFYLEMKLEEEGLSRGVNRDLISCTPTSSFISK